jgi:eukaryotic-like serine/threonine-protein kinase
VQSPPEPPSLRTELAIPEELERIVMSCLAKNPDERPSGAWELQRQLAACATPIWTEAEAEAWWQHHLPSTSSMRSFAQQASATPPVVRKI